MPLSFHSRAVSAGLRGSLPIARPGLWTASLSVYAPQWEGFDYYFSGAEQPSGIAAVYGWFEWGTTASYGSSSSPTLVSTGNQGPVAFNANIFSLTPNTLYHYRAAASNYLATGYSSDATFTTAGPPVINNPPQSQAIAPGANATFTVAASSGLPLFYQWEKNGVNIDSATTSVLTITSAQTSDAATYTVAVSNEYFGGWVVNSSATLNVGSAPAPSLQGTFGPGTLVMTWPVYNPAYSIQASTNLSSTNWTNAAVTLVTNGNTVTATITNISTNRRFFRLRSP